MALSDVRFRIGASGLGRPLAGEDHISALCFYSNNLPLGYSSSNRVNTVYSIEEAENLGIVDDRSDETAATGMVSITATGDPGDTIEILVNEGTGAVTLGTAVVPASPTTDTVAAALATAITALGTGYTAAVGTTIATQHNVYITPPVGRGDAANGYILTKNITSAASTPLNATLVQFTGGVDAFFDVMHYHISEFFRANDKGVLHVGIFDEPVGTYDFAEISTMQNLAGEKIRQIGVFVKETAFATSQLTAMQGVANTLSTNHRPLVILYGPDISTFTSLSSLPDLRTLSAGNVSVVIGEDGGNVGRSLALDRVYSITALGYALGTVSSASVAHNIGWVERFNASNIELDTLAFANKTLYVDVAPNLLETLNTNGYVFLRKFAGIDGSFFNYSHTAVTTSSDFATIENNRTIQKAIRGVYATVTAALNGPIKVLNTGQLPVDVMKYFEKLAGRPLEDMERDDELSGSKVIINPAQNVLATGKLVITLKLIPIGVSSEIEINIGFTTKIA